MECKPAATIASSFATNVSLTGRSFAVNLSRENRLLQVGPFSNASRYTYSPFDVLRGALATEGHFTSASSNRAITISQYAVQHERVREVRKLIVNELFASLGNRNARRAFLAAQTLGDALRGPIGGSGGSDWEDEFADTLTRLDAHIDSTLVSATVLVRVAESVHWHAFYGPDSTRAIAQHIIAKLGRDIETRTARALIDPWGSNTWPFEKETGRPQHEADTIALCDELNDQYAEPTALARFLSTRVEEINGATGNPDYGLGQIFISRLFQRNFEFARYIVERHLVGDTTHLASHAGRALGALLNRKQEDATLFVMQMLDAGDTQLVTVAEAYMFATHPATYDQVDLTALSRIFGSENAAVLRYTTHISLEIARRDKFLAIDLLSSTNIDLAMRSARDYFMWIVHEDTIPFNLIRDDQLARLINGLRNAPNLDDHWVKAFLKKAIKRLPGAVIDLAKARIDASIEKEDWSMQPLGGVLHDHDPLDLLAIPEGSGILRGLLDWALGRISDFHFSYRFAELVQSLCSPYGETCVATIQEWLNEGGTADHFKVVTAIVREAGPSFVTAHESFVARALRLARTVGRKVHSELSSAIFASSVSGVRSGAPGQPFDADVQLKKLAEDRIERITRADAAYALYAEIRDHSAREINRQIADGRRMDEEDEDA